MVFRGKPSKACERCRARRLRCDLHSGACGQCVRASVSCSGYRDTGQLRIHNESQAVAQRAFKNVHPFQPQSLPLSVDVQARDTFFAYYVTSTTTCWDFLKQYYHPSDAPDHLTLAIDAVSLAYLWHNVYSDVTLAAAREKYVSALRVANKCMKSSKEVIKDTTLMTSLVLDLYERITHCEPRINKSWISHLNGALTLARLRGLEQFQDGSNFSVLRRLSGYSLVSCVASGTAVPDDLIAIRAYIEKLSRVHDPRWHVSDLLVQYANLRNEIQRGILSNDECIGRSTELDIALQALDLDLPLSWQYSTTLLDHESDRIFDLRIDSYPDRVVSQTRNFSRLVRILLNESLIEYYLASLTGNKRLALIGVALDNIKTLALEICASVPQYVDCDGAARERLPTSEKSELPDHTSDVILDNGRVAAGHPHTPNHQLECYSLILPLYVAGRSNAFPDIRSWAIKELHYIGSHFYVRNAEVVAQILEQETYVCPWRVYAMLGSYAFTG